MKELMVPVTRKGKQELWQEYIYSLEELPLLEIATFQRTSNTRHGVSYIELPCAFDIETTTIIEEGARPYGYMYHWQLCLGKYVIFGRRWEEWLHALRYISDGLHLSAEGTRLVIYVHNLSYEYCYCRRFLNIVDGFYRAPYKPLKIITGDGFEFRDSYALSNMSLQAFCRNSKGCIHWKLEDSYDYRKIRTADTFMTDTELAYCYNDVRGLCECIAARLQDDTLATIPMTSTGYVRRDTRNAMRGGWCDDPKEAKRIARRNRQQFVDTALDANLYQMFRDAFRGGNTHANAAHAGHTIEWPVYSYDITSSYPAVMMEEYFPIGRWSPYSPQEQKKRDPGMQRYCYIFKVKMLAVTYTGKSGIPYISKDKCSACPEQLLIEDDRHRKRLERIGGEVIEENGICKWRYWQEDNGRIRQAPYLEMTVTEIDWKIIQETYHMETYSISDMYAAQKGLLPAEFRQVVMEYFRKKTELKGLDDEDSEYLYSRYKALLNALFGMTCTRPDMERIVYTPWSGPDHDEKEHEFIVEEQSTAERLEAFYKSRNSFLSYQWGIYVTAHARLRLQTMLERVGADVVYCDTDSIKYVGDHHADFAEMNSKLQRMAEEAGAYADNSKGKRYYLGTWDYEGCYTRFRTLGAKKYVYEKWHYVDSAEHAKTGEPLGWQKRIYCTIAGVNKKVGGRHFQRHGLSSFRIGEVIEESGHLVAYRNDDFPHHITIEGCTMLTASNIALVDDTYTIGVTDSYLNLLQMFLDGKEYVGKDQ